jgi:hypothetical protein
MHSEHSQRFRTFAHTQFALSFFLLFDAATISSHAKPPPDAPYDVVPVHMSFVDWIPAICSTRESFVYSQLESALLCQGEQSVRGEQESHQSRGLYPVKQ